LSIQCGVDVSDVISVLRYDDFVLMGLKGGEFGWPYMDAVGLWFGPSCGVISDTLF
jgi:hypothetical protein